MPDTDMNPTTDAGTGVQVPMRQDGGGGTTPIFTDAGTDAPTPPSGFQCASSQAWTRSFGLSGSVLALLLLLRLRRRKD